MDDVQRKMDEAADRLTINQVGKIMHPSDGCPTWLYEGLFMNHESITDDGINYSCAHCDVKLTGPNVQAE